MIRDGLQAIERKGVRYLREQDGTVRRFKPWLGDVFSFLYDEIMQRFIFPRKFRANQERHVAVLGRELEYVRGKHVLELATGTGSVTGFLSSSNRYTGTDISPGLLQRAVRNLRSAGFHDAACYVSEAEDLPFADGEFDVCLCVLSLNFFRDASRAIGEAARVLKPGGWFMGCVPDPERTSPDVTIRGTLYSEQDLVEIFGKEGFRFRRIKADNGALMYFRADRYSQARDGQEGA